MLFFVTKKFRDNFVWTPCIYYKLFRSILKTIPPLSPKLEVSGLKGQGMNRSFFINGLPIVYVLIKILLSKMF